MNEILIKFEGNDVIIRGPREILKIVINPAVEGIQKITEPAEPVITKRRMAKIIKQKPTKIVSKPIGKITALGKGKRVTQEIIDQIKYLRDDEKMNSKQIAEELGISLVTVNRHYRPLLKERGIN